MGCSWSNAFQIFVVYPFWIYLRGKHPLRDEILCSLPKSQLGWVQAHMSYFIVSGPKFTGLVSPNAGRIFLDHDPKFGYYAGMWQNRWTRTYRTMHSDARYWNGLINHDIMISYLCWVGSVAAMFVLFQRQLLDNNVERSHFSNWVYDSFGNQYWLIDWLSRV